MRSICLRSEKICLSDSSLLEMSRPQFVVRAGSCELWAVETKPWRWLVIIGEDTTVPKYWMVWTWKYPKIAVWMRRMLEMMINHVILVQPYLRRNPYWWLSSIIIAIHINQLWLMTSDFPRGCSFSSFWHCSGDVQLVSETSRIDWSLVPCVPSGELT